MGKPLKNPPVYFTVVQARFNALLKLEEYVPSVQEAMRKAGYSDFTTHKTVAVQIAAQDGQVTPSTVPVEQFLFGNAGKTHSFVLDRNALTLQSTRYGTFEDFSALFLRGLALVHEVVQLDFTERVGLRYLDHVAPLPNDSLDEYLVPGAFGLSSHLGGKSVYSFSETLRRIDDMQLRARVLIQEGGLAFPPELAPQGMMVDERFMKHSGHHAVLDTDGFIEGRMAFSVDAVGERLHAIHGIVSNAFKAIVTEHALNVWNES